ncbi:hypothetical protein CEUSTIGMA_g8366.t1 [Chlamydomonas eustigma]|uniref:VHS domain-containing protein n=1 Tax=Chlamydomonas eustigma TaxID=1157962 RepID=A0A250XCX8_9CHLO|nr:hypothetical protein CEUSTIGMA_g8366.t1 [Chlamydomonas eustigma]|eukprot:GAX80931.1 hypothetical protein CEUSTIGMA_g8366.t1 [Chlamydomonas eustigma]
MRRRQGSKGQGVIVKVFLNESVTGERVAPSLQEVVGLLKARLHMDNPQKQFLAVKLIEQVMTDCSAVLGLYQSDILQAVAVVMNTPAKPGTDAGRRARQAAMELLRKYGQAGTSAVRAVRSEARPVAAMTGYAGPPPYGFPPPGGPPMPGMVYQYPPGYPPAAGAFGPGAGVNMERQSVIDEVRQLIEKARSNTELLSDMLVNSNSTGDEFETELVKDLANEVRELRELFNAYLEQIGAMEGPDMEQLLVQALEATDMLDGAISLQKVRSGLHDGAIALQKVNSGLNDGAIALQKVNSGLNDGAIALQKVRSDLNDGAIALQKVRSGLNDGAIALQKVRSDLNDGAIASQKVRSGLHDGAIALQKVRSGLNDGAIALQKDVALNQREGSFQQSTAAATPGAPAVNTTPPSADLIGFDDLADALTTSAVLQQPSGHIAGGAPSAAVDPFAAPQSRDPFAPPAPAVQPAAPTGDPFAASVPHDPFAGVVVPAAATAAAAYPYPTPGMAPFPTGLQAGPASGAPVANAQMAPSPVKQSAFANMFAQPGASAAYASLADNTPVGQQFAGPVAAPTNPYMQQLPAQQAYGSTLPASTPSPYPPQFSQPSQFQGPGQAPYVQQYGAVAPPFPGGTYGQQQPTAAAFGAPLVSPNMSNPFHRAGGTMPVTNTAAAVDKEWDMFFADRTGANVAPPK